jgi:hypothetical protein
VDARKLTTLTFKRIVSAMLMWVGLFGQQEPMVMLRPPLLSSAKRDRRTVQGGVL